MLSIRYFTFICQVCLSSKQAKWIAIAFWLPFITCLCGCFIWSGICFRLLKLSFSSKDCHSKLSFTTLFSPYDRTMCNWPTRNMKKNNKEVAETTSCHFMCDVKCRVKYYCLIWEKQNMSIVPLSQTRITHKDSFIVRHFYNTSLFFSLQAISNKTIKKSQKLVHVVHLVSNTNYTHKILCTVYSRYNDM